MPFLVCLFFFSIKKASSAKEEQHCERQVPDIELLQLFFRFGLMHTCSYTHICSSSLKKKCGDLHCSMGHFLQGPKAASPLNTHENLIRASLIQRARRWESLGNDTVKTLTLSAHALQINRE